MKTTTEQQRNTSGNNGSNSTDLGELLEMADINIRSCYYDADQGYVIGDRYIAEICGWNGPSDDDTNKRLREEQRSNARYIAHACNSLPVLVEALEEIVHHAFDDDTPRDELEADFDRMRAIAFLALHKAKTIET